MAPGHVPAYLFAILIATLAYGIAVTLFAESVSTIVRKRRATGKLNLPLAIPSILIFMFSTVNIIGLWLNTYMTFVVHGADPMAYLSLIRSPAKTLFQTGEIGAIVLTDALVVYRTLVVWNYNVYVIVIPCLTFVATLTSAITYVELQHHTDVETSIFTKTVTQWTVAFLLSSFATSVYSTGLIAYKLLNTQIRLRRLGISTNSSLSTRIMRIIAESAAIYSLNHLLYAILYEVKTQVEMTTGFLEANVASITCSLIIIRSEDALNQPLTLPTSVGSQTVSSVDAEKGLKNEDGKALMLGSMKVNVNISKTTDEGV